MPTPRNIRRFRMAGRNRAQPHAAPQTAVISPWADWYELTKPRMNFLVVVTTAVGFYMAGRSAVNYALLLNTIFGTVLTAAGAAVLNQWWERDLDRLMPRTINRPLPSGRIAPRWALIFGIALGIVGTLWLALFVNNLTALLGAATLLSYLFLYTPLKRHSSLNTVIGAIPGAIPPMMGFTAVNGALTPGAIALFAILFVWQLPHFMAIAILYKDDYAAAGFRMLPVEDENLSRTSLQIVLWGLALIPVSLTPTVLGMAGPMYFTAAVLLSIGYLTFGLSAAASKTRTDARKLFFASIIYLPLLLTMMMIDRT